MYNYRRCSKYLMNNIRSKILEEWWEFGGGGNDISSIPQSI